MIDLIVETRKRFVLSVHNTIVMKNVLFMGSLVPSIVKIIFYNQPKIFDKNIFVILMISHHLSLAQIKFFFFLMHIQLYRVDEIKTGISSKNGTKIVMFQVCRYEGTILF